MQEPERECVEKPGCPARSSGVFVPYLLRRVHANQQEASDLCVSGGRFAPGGAWRHSCLLRTDARNARRRETHNKASLCCPRSRHPLRPSNPLRRTLRRARRLLLPSRCSSRSTPARLSPACLPPQRRRTAAAGAVVVLEATPSCSGPSPSRRRRQRRNLPQRVRRGHRLPVGWTSCRVPRPRAAAAAAAALATPSPA